jgi:predicted GNAT family N-acyltransferase
LRSLGGVGEVIAVNAIESERRAGHGGTALAAAVATSRQHNHLTMLAADVADWPREWYRRLGFVEVGDVWEFDSVCV